MIEHTDIDELTLHCSASNVAAHDNIDVIRSWHLARGWEDVGYHYFIRQLGEIQRGRAEQYMGAHCRGHNRNSLGICFHGSKPWLFSPHQFKSGIALVQHLVDKYNIKKEKVRGHNFYNVNKDCPRFSITEQIKRYIIWPSK